MTNLSQSFQNPDSHSSASVYLAPASCRLHARRLRTRGGAAPKCFFFSQPLTSTNHPHVRRTWTESCRPQTADRRPQTADRRPQRRSLCMLWFQTLSQKLGKDSILRLILAVIENAPVTISGRRRELNELPRSASSKENGDGWSRSSCFVIFQDNNNNRLQQWLY